MFGKEAEIVTGIDHHQSDQMSVREHSGGTGGAGLLSSAIDIEAAFDRVDIAVGKLLKPLDQGYREMVAMRFRALAGARASASGRC